MFFILKGICGTLFIIINNVLIEEINKNFKYKTIEPFIGKRVKFYRVLL